MTFLRCPASPEALAAEFGVQVSLGTPFLMVAHEQFFWA
jgi:hypothetical protein